MHAPQGLAPHEPFQSLDSERELAERQRAFRGYGALPKPIEISWCQVLRSIDDAEVFRTTALHGRLDESLRSESDEVKRLDDHPFAAF